MREKCLGKGHRRGGSGGRLEVRVGGDEMGGGGGVGGGGCREEKGSRDGEGRVGGK